MSKPCRATFISISKLQRTSLEIEPKRSANTLNVSINTDRAKCVLQRYVIARHTAVPSIRKKKSYGGLSKVSVKKIAYTHACTTRERGEDEGQREREREREREFAQPVPIWPESFYRAFSVRSST